MKRQPGKDIMLIGGGEIASAFMEADLIDDYCVTVYPVVLGEGKPLFKEMTNRISLKLERSRTFKSGPVELRYWKA